MPRTCIRTFYEAVKDDNMTGSKENHHLAKQPLPLTESLFQSVVDHMLDALLILDWNGTILFANQSAAEFVHPGFLEVVILDLMNVQEGGGGYLNRYKLLTAEGRRHTPIIALTAFALKEDDVKKSIAAGCDTHLNKPVKKEKILATIMTYTSSV